jgi:hypothetical protein
MRVSGIVGDKAIDLLHRTRNISISDSLIEHINIDLGDGAYPIGTGAGRIMLQNISTCFALTPGPYVTPVPANDPNFGQPNGPSSPVLNNTLNNTPRQDIVYTNIGYICGGG